MYGCESWTIRKAEDQRIDAFELWCWRRLLRVPWAAKISNQSFLKEISPEYSLEGLMLKLKLHCFGHLMQRANSLEKTLMLGKIEGKRRRGWQRMRCLNGITDSIDMCLTKLSEMVLNGEAWCTAVHGVAKTGHDWTTTATYMKSSRVALVIKYLPINAGEKGSFPGLEKSPDGGYCNPLQYSGLENPRDRGTWQAIIHRVAKSQTRLKQLSIHAHILYM